MSTRNRRHKTQGDAIEDVTGGVRSHVVHEKGWSGGPAGVDNYPVIQAGKEKKKRLRIRSRLEGKIDGKQRGKKTSQAASFEDKVQGAGHKNLGGGTQPGEPNLLWKAVRLKTDREWSKNVRFKGLYARGGV